MKLRDGLPESRKGVNVHEVERWATRVQEGSECP